MRQDRMRFLEAGTISGNVRMAGGGCEQADVCAVSRTISGNVRIMAVKGEQAAYW